MRQGIIPPPPAASRPRLHRHAFPTTAVFAADAQRNQEDKKPTYFRICRRVAPALRRVWSSDAGRSYCSHREGRRMTVAGLKGAGAGAPPKGLLGRIFSWLYGDLPPGDRLRVAWLSGTLFCIMGG